MISRRSLNNILIAVVCAVVLLGSSRFLDVWVWNDEDYHTGRFGAKNIDVLNATSTGSYSHTNTHAVPTATPSDKPIKSGPDLSSPDYDSVCKGFPDTSGIFLVMKTGATESFDRIPTQLMTALGCLPDFLIFSDLEQRIAGFQVRDSLGTVLAEASDDNADFDLYRQQKACAVDQETCAKAVDGPKDAGWNLDKYKNIHMAEETYRMRPGFDWYVFVDADTYVSWPNLVRMLHRLDPTRERYLGSTTMLDGMPFGHGGSGYAVSGAAMRKFVGENPGVANDFDVRTKDVCCGDYMFAVALNETIGLTVESIVSVGRVDRMHSRGGG